MKKKETPLMYLMGRVLYYIFPLYLQKRFKFVFSSGFSLFKKKKRKNSQFNWRHERKEKEEGTAATNQPTNQPITQKSLNGVISSVDYVYYTQMKSIYTTNEWKRGKLFTTSMQIDLLFCSFRFNECKSVYLLHTFVMVLRLYRIYVEKKQTHNRRATVKCRSRNYPRGSSYMQDSLRAGIRVVAF